MTHRTLVEENRAQTEMTHQGSWLHEKPAKHILCLLRDVYVVLIGRLHVEVLVKHSTMFSPKVTVRDESEILDPSDPGTEMRTLSEYILEVLTGRGA